MRLWWRLPRWSRHSCTVAVSSILRLVAEGKEWPCQYQGCCRMFGSSRDESGTLQQFGYRTGTPLLVVDQAFLASNDHSSCSHPLPWPLPWALPTALRPSAIFPSRHPPRFCASAACWQFVVIAITTSAPRHRTGIPSDSSLQFRGQRPHNVICQLHLLPLIFLDKTVVFFLRLVFSASLFDFVHYVE